MEKSSPTLPMVGGVFAAIGASLCCVLPFVLVLLGVGGTWMATLANMQAYSPYFTVAVIVFFAWAGYQLYRPIEKCKPGSVCAIPASRKRYRIFFWIGTIFSLALVAGPYWIPLFL